MKEFIKSPQKLIFKNKKRNGQKVVKRLITESNDQCSTCSSKKHWNDLHRCYAWILFNALRVKFFFTQEKRKWPKKLSVSHLFFLLFFLGYRNVKLPFKETAPLTHSYTKRPDEMISPYSIIFISPLQCCNRWPACSSKISYNFVAPFIYLFFSFPL